MSVSPVVADGGSLTPIGSVFASTASTIDDVLTRNEMSDYLFQQRTMPKSVLNFVERNLEELLELGRYVFTVDDADAATPVTSNAVVATAADIPAAPGATNRNRYQSGAHDILEAAPDNAASGPSQAVSQQPSKSFMAIAASNQLRVHGNDRGSVRYSVRATELLTVYISATKSIDVIETAATHSMSAMALEAASIPSMALALQRLLLASFDVDFAKTTEAIADALTEEVVQLIIRNVAQSSVIAETVIALFGSALPAMTMMSPNTQTQRFTEAWIRCRFPQQLCAYLALALGSPSRYNYFYFIREILKRGFSHSAGPIVDVMLEHELWEPFVKTVMVRCETPVKEQTVSPRSPSKKYTTPSDLSADGMVIVSAVVALVRKSVIVPETVAMYFTSVGMVAPLLVMDEYAERFVRLLNTEKGPMELSSPRRGLGMTRLAVCEMFTELMQYRLASTDEIVIRSGFLPAFLAVCQQHRDHDILIRLLHKCVTHIFSRPLLLGESLMQSLQRDVLLRYVVLPLPTNGAMTVALNASNSATAAPSLATVTGSSTAASIAEPSNALVHRITKWATDPMLRDTALSAHCINILRDLATMPLFTGPLSLLLEPYTKSTESHLRIRVMQEEITGCKFAMRGSGAQGPVVHRKLINLAGPRFTADVSATFSNSSPVFSRNANSNGGSNSDGGSRPESPPPVPRAAGQSPSNGTVVKPRPEVDMAILEKELLDLRQAGSPQLQAYPSFKSMSFDFSQNAKDKPTDVSTPVAGAVAKGSTVLIPSQDGYATTGNGASPRKPATSPAAADDPETIIRRKKLARLTEILAQRKEQERTGNEEQRAHARGADEGNRSGSDGSVSGAQENGGQQVPLGHVLSGQQTNSSCSKRKAMVSSSTLIARRSSEHSA